MNEQLLSWQIKCVWLMMRRERGIQNENCVLGAMCVLGRWRRDAGKVVQRDDARLRVGRGGDWRLIYRY